MTAGKAPCEVRDRSEGGLDHLQLPAQDGHNVEAELGGSGARIGEVAGGQAPPPAPVTVT